MSKTAFLKDKLLRVLGEKWKPEKRFLGIMPKIQTIENSFYLDLPNNLRIYLILHFPDESSQINKFSITLSIDRVVNNSESPFFELYLSNITSIEYWYTYRKVVFESKQKDVYSEIVLFHTGFFKSYSNRSLSLYPKEDLKRYIYDGEEVEIVKV